MAFTLAGGRDNDLLLLPTCHSHEIASVSKRQQSNQFFMVLHIFLFREAVSLEYISQKWFLVSANFKICIISLLGKPVKHIVDSSCTTKIFVQANHECDFYWLL